MLTKMKKLPKREILIYLSIITIVVIYSIKGIQKEKNEKVVLNEINKNIERDYLTSKIGLSEGFEEIANNYLEVMIKFQRDVERLKDLKKKESKREKENSEYKFVTEYDKTKPNQNKRDETSEKLLEINQNQVEKMSKTVTLATLGGVLEALSQNK